ncbi:hypothetical protein [Helicobacter turcicus]|uniref:Restriction endonuclease subunit S n=1 Tax=Helicobacter turcicus TaxID=2867412 RepID=A0ABS7JMY7_9HELI|nr:hypothetical protein [Helicobacter turcicus]MBX7490745.1 hypothetical protein [Helicobacter turcicus]MBX7545646.1 hypothetical protein [Helicobacter turcicus]
MAYIDVPKEINSKEVLENECNLSASSYKHLDTKRAKTSLSKKYENLLQDFYSLDGYAFSSNIFTSNPNQALPLIQISNVNQSDFYLSKQFNRFIPNINAKEKFLLDKPCVLLSLTGGENQDNISAFCEGNEKFLLNQRVSAYFHKTNKTHFLYLFLAFTKHNFFKSQMQGKGGVQKNIISSDKEKLYVPKITDNKVLEFIEILTQSIIIKEKLIKERHTRILNIIESELLNNQKPNAFCYTYPTFKELQESGRLDTGIYCEEFKKLDFLIKNYKNGVFYIDEKKIKSGSTPKTRFIGKEEFLLYQWISPSHCSDYGTIKEVERINFIGKPNLTQDCILLINRGQGYDCGKSIFYSFMDSKKGQHNQGMYRVFDYPEFQMLFMLCFLNAKFMRTYCSYLSLGSKMKELKIEHFLQIPFPNFPKNLQEQIALLYHNPNTKLDYKNLNLENFKIQDEAFCKNAGIYELDKSIKYLKNILNSCIDNIVNDREVKIDFGQIDTTQER